MAELVNSHIPSPNDDFYTHINWEWLQSNPIPSEYTKWGNFHVLQEQNQYRLRDMLESSPTTEEQKKLNILWTQGLDIDNLNSQGHEQVKNLFDKFKLGESVDTFIVELMKYNLCFLFDISAYTDFKDSNRNVLYFDVMGLGLPDRDYYFLENMKDKKEQYKEFLEKFINHFSLDATVDDIYSFEWDGNEEEARLLQNKPNARIRWRWLSDEEDGLDVYFEIAYIVDPMTSSVSLQITDFADPSDKESAIMLWTQQVTDLKRVLGS
jgi:predicted metalloendopeptidase